MPFGLLAMVLFFIFFIFAIEKPGDERDPAMGRGAGTDLFADGLYVIRNPLALATHEGHDGASLSYQANNINQSNYKEKREKRE
jgi:hypothetical protein